ncbi:MAG: FKBP-type peptidyl-prolyl cis-trans isomerase, partial [Gammaproteobacteria bacterium]|nr:FKBP-type peptidyl-prolyl cis-trans isomerase [Gammaproteobacteria bacterium]
MNRVFLLVAVLMTTLSCEATQPAKPETDEQKLFYALGMAISQNLSRYELTADELDMVQAGLADGVNGADSQVDMETYGPQLAELARARAQAAADSERMKSAEFVAAQAKTEGAVSHESGLLYFELQPGDGESPAATDTVTVHYHGTLRDG